MSAPKTKAARLCKNRTAIKNATYLKNNLNAMNFIACNRAGGMTHSPGYLSRRTHFSLSYYINSKQYSTHERCTPFFNGENDGLPHARQDQIEAMKFQICPAIHPRKTRKTLFLGLADGKPLQVLVSIGRNTAP